MSDSSTVTHSMSVGVGNGLMPKTKLAFTIRTPPSEETYSPYRPVTDLSLANTTGYNTITGLIANVYG